LDCSSSLTGCCFENRSLEPIQRFLILQLQRQRCSRLERFYIGKNVYSKNALGYWLRCKFLQRSRCKSKSYVGLGPGPSLSDQQTRVVILIWISYKRFDVAVRLCCIRQRIGSQKVVGSAPEG
jgi:hypothetical protein